MSAICAEELRVAYAQDAGTSVTGISLGPTRGGYALPVVEP